MSSSQSAITAFITRGSRARTSPHATELKAFVTTVAGRDAVVANTLASVLLPGTGNSRCSLLAAAAARRPAACCCSELLADATRRNEPRTHRDSALARCSTRLTLRPATRYPLPATRYPLPATRY